MPSYSIVRTPMASACGDQGNMVEARLAHNEQTRTAADLVLSKYVFRLARLALVTMHIFAGIASCVVASAAAIIVVDPGRLHLIERIRKLGVDVDSSILRALAVLDGIIAISHFKGAFGMVYRSKTLVFGTDDERSCRRSSECSCSRLWYILMAPWGAVSVRGRYFEVAFVIRELLEVASQSFQCFWISKYVSQVWLSRFSVSLLVLNCWSTPLLHLVQSYRPMSVMALRTCCLAIDVVLDIFMATILPMLVIAPYLLYITNGNNGAAIWIAQLKSDFQLLIPLRWPTLMTQVLPMLSTLQALGDIKSLIRVMPQAKQSALTVVPHPRASGEILQASYHFPSSSSMSSNDVRTRHMKALHLIFVAWGLTILGVYSSDYYRRGALTTDICRAERRPMLAKQIVCEVVVVDCHRLGIQGSATEIQTLLSPFALDEIGALTFAHCTALIIPVELTQMVSLIEFAIYNSTLLAWDEDAGLTGHSHPFVFRIIFYLVDLDAAGNTIPSGLVSRNDPPAPMIFAFGRTNLSLLTTDFASTWRHEMMFLVFEHSQMPVVMPQMATMNVSVGVSYLGNDDLCQIPAALFIGAHRVVLDNNRALRLPLATQIPPGSAVPSIISIQNTSIESIPSWIYDANVAEVYAWNTPICAANSSRRVQQTMIECRGFLLRI